MKMKNEIRHGETIGTRLQSDWGLMLDELHPFHAVRTTLYEVEGELDHAYNEMRHNVRQLAQHLLEVERRLEENLQVQAKVSRLMDGVNSLGEVQGRGNELDRLIAIVTTLAKTHSLIVRSTGDRNEDCELNAIKKNETED